MPNGIEVISDEPLISSFINPSDQAIGFHSITFASNRETKNTWDDWHLVPTSRPLVAPPEVKTHFIEIPGSNNYVDMTEAIAGKPIYRNRTGSWEFLVINSKQLDAVKYVNNNGVQQMVVTTDYGTWYNRYSEIMNYLHGQDFDIVLNDDLDYYYTGRLTVNSWKSRKNNSTITIDYNLDPYKRDIASVNGNWLWDPFCFEPTEENYELYGVIRTYKNLRVKTHLQVDFIVNSAITSTPVFTTTAIMSVEYDGTTWLLDRGRNYLDDMSFIGPDGQPKVHNILDIYGDGYVTIEAIGGIL